MTTTIVIFGATGDLFKKKLAQVFFDICQKKRTEDTFTIIGLSRKHLSHGEFREMVVQILEKEDKGEVEKFVAKLYYYSIDATDEFSLADLREILDKVDQSYGVCSNKLFYIATVPSTYELIFKNISVSGLGIPCASQFKEKNAWIKIIVEKPFGNDVKSAKQLDLLLGQSFTEDQIYRIDHYLAKETVQAISSFRFENELFKDIWNKDHIKQVHLFVYEDEKKDTINARKKFYDEVGALNDVGQNHLLEMLSLIAMRKPQTKDAPSIRANRALVLQSVCIDEMGQILRGQYEGYREGEYSSSETETYFRAGLKVSLPEWEGVPFVIEHGKMLSETKTAIVIYLKAEGDVENKIEFKIQPEAEICVEMVVQGEKRNMCFNLLEKENQFIYPYEKLVLDAILGDQTLFVSTEEVKEGWRIAESIKKQFSKTNLTIYKKGSVL